MTTHFHPRPSTSAPQSPARPVSARSTIRAIPPSPPQGMSDATNGSRAQSEKPYGVSPDVKEQPLTRPWSEEISRARNHSLKSEKIEGALESTRDNVVGLQRGGAGMARRSPVRRQGRSKSHRGKPNTSPTRQPSRRRIPADDQSETVEEGTANIKHNESKKVHDYHHKDVSIDWPDTPTPMTLSQKRSAYLPLVSPTPIVLPKRTSSIRPSPDPVPTANNPAASQEPPPSSNISNVNLKKPLTDHTTQRTNSLAQHPHIHSHASLTSNKDEKTKPTAPQQPQEKTYHLPFHQNPQATAPPANAINQAPSQARVGPPPCKPIPVSCTPAQHLTSLSRVSNNSGGTAQSQRSVFSTPGRDELERKKAMVEADEGPFGRVVSVAQLNEARKVVSGGGYDDDDGYDGKRRKREKRCGVSRGCSVM